MDWDCFISVASINEHLLIAPKLPKTLTKELLCAATKELRRYLSAILLAESRGDTGTGQKETVNVTLMHWAEQDQRGKVQGKQKLEHFVTPLGIGTEFP